MYTITLRIEIICKIFDFCVIVMKSIMNRNDYAIKKAATYADSESYNKRNRVYACIDPKVSVQIILPNYLP